jgi:hypothetical protein
MPLLVFKTKDGRFLFGIFDFQTVRVAACAQNDFNNLRICDGVGQMTRIGCEASPSRISIIGASLAAHLNVNSGERQVLFNSIIGRHRAELAF